MHKRDRRLLGLAGLSLAIMAGCDSSDAPEVAPDLWGSDATDTSAETGPNPDAEAPRVDAPACASLEPGEPLSPGLWASRQRQTSFVSLPPTGELQEVTNTRLVLHEVAHEGGEVRVTHRTCALTQPPMSGVETIFGAAFVAAVPSNTVVAQVEGADVTIPADLVLLGAELDDPADDPLPIDPEDPRVIDGDGDGEPGMTVALQGLFQARLFITYRQKIGFEGTADLGGCIEGRLVGTVEQTQIGASDEALMNFDFSPRPHPNPDISTFVMVPVEADLDCSGLIAAQASVFGP